jgi:glycosyltransferase involved in cell wall biosynthesis
MTADPRPLVSILVPSFNQGRYIRETLDSCLAQDWRPLEIIVMDGGSTDSTLDVLRSYAASELQWVSERDGGVVDAVNKAIARSRGEILTVQSSDDLFLPGAVTAAVQALRSQPEAALAYGDVELIDAASARIGEDRQGPFDFARYIGRLQYIPQPGAFFRRAALEIAPGWRAQFSYAADADFWMRIAARRPVVKMDRLVACYRYHDEQRDTQRARIARDWEGAVHDLLASGRLDRRERRFARMGIHLARHRYLGEARWLERTRELYAAALANPAALFDRSFPKRELIPGRTPLWAAMSRVKRRLGLKPRGT